MGNKMAEKNNKSSKKQKLNEGERTIQISLESICALSFMIIVLLIGFASNAIWNVSDLFSVLAGGTAEGTVDANGVSAVLSTPEEVILDFPNDMAFKQGFIELNGFMARILGMRGFYAKDGILVSHDRVIVGSQDETSADYETEQMKKLKAVLDRKGTKLLFAAAPSKYVDDEFMMQEFGISSYCNANVDLFLKRLREETSIESLDLREEMAKEKKDVSGMFYRTDHHWTVESGYWATRQIVEKLNETFQYGIDESLFSEDAVTPYYYEKVWLGEQGRKIARSYIGLDDYIELVPKYETMYSFIQGSTGARIDGDFLTVFVNEDVYKEKSKDYYDGPLWHYSYAKYGLSYSQIYNHLNPSGKKVLMLCDSFSNDVVPFLSAAFAELDTLLLRDIDVDLIQYLDQTDYNLVLILYSPGMIGAHDDPESANYRMFTFDGGDS